MPDRNTQERLANIDLGAAAERVSEVAAMHSGDLDLDDGKLSDDQMALDLGASWLDENGRYLQDMGQWLFWNENRWKPQHKTAIMAVTRRFVRLVASELENAVGWQALKQEKRQKIMNGLRSSGKISAVARVAQTNPESSSLSEHFDTDPELLNTPDGILNLRTNELRSVTRDDHVTKVTSVSPAAGTPRKWLEFLSWASGGDQSWIDYMQVVAGQNLIGNNLGHQFFFKFGPGGNGKSTYDEIEDMILGDYAAMLSSKYLMMSSMNEHSTGLTDIRGARKVTASEIPAANKWNLQLLKQLTGDEKMKARRMRSDEIEFLITWTMNITGNNRPTIPKVDEAIKRRLVLIPFTQVMPKSQQNKNLKAEIFAEEGPQILSWMAIGALRYLQGEVPRCEAIEMATAAYLESEDMVGQFVEEYLDIDPEAHILNSELKILFDRFSANWGMNPWTLRAVKSALSEHLGASIRDYKNSGKKGLRGIGPKSGGGRSSENEDRVSPF